MDPAVADVVDVAPEAVLQRAEEDIDLFEAHQTQRH
jgi:hypothetical protein